MARDESSTEEAGFERNWVITGSVCGIAGSLAYPVLLAVPLPGVLETVVAGGFGILVGVSGFGLYRLIALHAKTVSAQLATVFLYTAGVIVNMMLVIQLTQGGYMDRYRSETTDEALLETLSWVHRGVAPVHLGLDVSWDFFVGLATVLYGLNLWRHPRFGRFFGGTGVFLGGQVLVINLYAFPFTPEEVGIPGFYGPAMGVWFMVVYIQALRSLAWVEQAAATAS